jgi:large subunit ribosomal protein L18
MRAEKIKQVRRVRRKHRVRKSVFGTAQKPRLTVFRSLKNIYAQIVDDQRGVTLCAASTQGKDLRTSVTYGGNIDAAKAVGKTLAERAASAGIAQVCFDRNGYKFHGRIKALADAAREAGLKF